MSSPSFSQFYHAVHGRPAFPWQDGLAARVLAGDWPDTIAVPTGCGKTSVIDIAVYALSMQGDMSSTERTAALRVFFVVDRRLVVDDVSRHADKLAEAIRVGTADELVWARRKLSTFGGSLPLMTAVLRGGMYRSNTWADAPNQPLVCVSTVDQVGSRLLFRGYGVSECRRPVDAALIGNDSLLIVDEAHLSQPFLDTLGWVQRYQGPEWREDQTAPGMRFVKMSATAKESSDRFGLGANDLESKALAPRLRAEKIADLKECAALPDMAAKEAIRLADAGAGVVGVVLNTVAAARATFESLRSSSGQSVLLTGRVRPYDRDLLLAEFGERMRAGRDRVESERLFVVATQTVEVGADLDFDGLVTEIASLDALRQRFGRLDRLGQRVSTRAVILKPRRAADKDWVYGDAAENTWKWLQEHGGTSIDFGVLKMGELWAASGAENVNTCAAEGPLLFPAHLDAWVQTNPAPGADPDVAPFLHGSKALDASDVLVVWRGDLAGDDPMNWVETIEAAPPMSTEALPIPVWAAKRWLSGGRPAVADIEGIQALEGEQDLAGRLQFLVWRGPEKSQQGVRSLRPGDTIVMPCSAGGCDRYGWNPASTADVADIGDLCANRRTEEGGGKYRLRVHPMVLFPEDREMREELCEILKRVASDDADAIEGLEQFVEHATAGRLHLEVAAREVRWNRAIDYAPSGLLVESRWIKGPKPLTVVEMEETDERDRSSLTLTVGLAAHTAGVVRKATEFLKGCGLNGPVAAAVVKAAQMHDEGKRDLRFQLLLGNSGTEPWAKSEKCSPREFKKRLEESGYPKGARHEFASLARAAASVEWAKEVDRELALYLIGTHHGYGRPFAPGWDGEGEPAQELALLDSGWIDRFWMLTRKYGWWGAAYLEAILRRADCVRSREEEDERCLASN